MDGEFPMAIDSLSSAVFAGAVTLKIALAQSNLVSQCTPVESPLDRSEVPEHVLEFPPGSMVSHTNHEDRGGHSRLHSVKNAGGCHPARRRCSF
jgi:hypothetical protein